MKENMFDVLMYLFENYYMDEELEMSPDRESLHTELVEAGFPASEISQAFAHFQGGLQGAAAMIFLVKRGVEQGHDLIAINDITLFITNDETVTITIECKADVGSKFLHLCSHQFGV